MTLEEIFNLDTDEMIAALSSQNPEDYFTTEKDLHFLANQFGDRFITECFLPENLSERGNHRVLVIPETHINGQNIKTRKDYLSEMKSIFNAVERLIDEAKPDYVIFMGEIFNGSIKSAKEVLYWVFTLLRVSEKTRILSVKGNHEDSFYVDNPFWYLAKGCGIVNGQGTIELLPNLILDEVSFTFHHHNVPVVENKAKVNIGIMHRDIMPRGLKDIIDEDNNYFYVDASSSNVGEIFGDYDIVLNGHMHKLHGMFKLTRPSGRNLLLIYTSSNGRTNRTEVHENFLFRNHYILDITGEVVDVKIAKLKLPLDVLATDVIEKEKVKVEINSERKAMKKNLKTLELESAIKTAIASNPILLAYEDYANNLNLTTAVDLRVGIHNSQIGDVEENARRNDTVTKY